MKWIQGALLGEQMMKEDCPIVSFFSERRERRRSEYVKFGKNLSELVCLVSPAVIDQKYSELFAFMIKA